MFLLRTCLAPACPGEDENKVLSFLLTLAQSDPLVPEQPPGIAESSGDYFSLAVVVLLGLAVSYAAGRVIASLLRTRHFDDLFIPPWKPAFNRQESDRWRASTIVRWFVSLTGAVALVWGTAQYYSYSHSFIDQMVSICGLAWMLLVTILIALGISKVVAGAVLCIFQNQTIRKQLELFCPHAEGANSVTKKTATDVDNSHDVSWNAGNESNEENSSVQQTIAQFAEEPVEPSGSHSNVEPSGSHSSTVQQDAISGEKKSALPEAFADTIARLVGLLVYLIVFLPVFMVTSALWQWSDTSSALSSIWLWLLPFVSFSAVILLGWFVVTAAILTIVPASRKGTVMMGTAILALLLLIASFNTAFAMIFSVAIGVICWITRNDLPDAFGGWYLRSQSNLSAKTPMGAGQVVRVQLLTSDLATVNGSFRVRNRHVLRSYLDGEMIAESRLIPIDEAGNQVNGAAE